MKKKLLAALAALSLITGLLAGCGGNASSSEPASTPESVASVASAPGESTPDSEVDGSGKTAEETTFRIMGLKGPTTMGMVKLMEDADNGRAAHDYQVEMAGTADEIVPKLVSGEIDVAAVPANLASVLYNRTEGGVQVAAINTLGVLYVVETGDTVTSIEDLRGKTIYSTGKGTTPEFALNYILEGNGLDPATDLAIEYKSESTEIAAILAENSDAIALLPQPYVTAVQKQNENLRVALNLTEEWDKVSTGSGLVTGVLVARKGFIEENPVAFADFLADYKASIEYVNANAADAAQLVAEYGIVEAAPVAEAAIPFCNIVYIDGTVMEATLSGYLEVLYNANPEAVGGALPAEDFYYNT